MRAFAHLARALCMALIVSSVVSTSEVLASSNVSAYGGVKIAKELEATTCFNSGGCGAATTTVQGQCTNGAYIYKILGYSGSNTSPSNYANALFCMCSDGSVVNVGQAGSYISATALILNPEGFTAVSATGGCITDHIQIGGVDLGNVGYPGSLSACTCSATGTKLSGFASLLYQASWPSFASMSIICSNACPKGYYFQTYCYQCPSGTPLKCVFLVLNLSRNFFLPRFGGTKLMLQHHP